MGVCLNYQVTHYLSGFGRSQRKALNINSFILAKGIYIHFPFPCAKLRKIPISLIECDVSINYFYDESRREQNTEIKRQALHDYSL